MSNQKVILLCTTLMLASSTSWACDDGKLPQYDDRWGFFSLKKQFLHKGKPRGDVVEQYQALSPQQQVAVTKALREKQDRSGGPVDPRVGATYDSLLETILESLPSSVAVSGEDLALALVPAPSHSQATNFWDYQKIRSKFFKDLGKEPGQSYTKKAVCSEAEEIFKSLPTSSQGLLMAYLALKLEGRVGKNPLAEGLKPLFKELFSRCDSCPRIAGVAFPDAPLDPKRPGMEYTARELEQSGFLLQGVSPHDFLKKLSEYFTELRGMKLLEDIVNAEDNSVPDKVAPAPFPVDAGKLLNVTVGDDGGVILEFVGDGVANVEPLSVLRPLSKEELERAVTIRESVKALKGTVIPASTKVVPVVPSKDLPSQAGVISVVDGLAQDVMMDPILAKLAKGTVGVHNFANARKLGGGAWNGRSPQEECLMRALPEVLVSYMCVPGRRRTDVFLSPGEVMVTPGVDAHSHILVLAAALPWVHSVGGDGSVVLHHEDVPTYGKKALSKAEYVTQLETDVLNLLAVAQNQGVDYLITGAWGSGVYNNDPELVSSIFQKTLNAEDCKGKLWKNHFKEILFVIPKLNGDGSVSANYAVYEKAFAG
ncbi:MAG: poly(ADP-ribose) glycohydrolase domain-containing protein [Alphaproteobacteria bacterium]